MKKVFSLLSLCAALMFSLPVLADSISISPNGNIYNISTNLCPSQPSGGNWQVGGPCGLQNTWTFSPISQGLNACVYIMQGNTAARNVSFTFSIAETPDQQNLFSASSGAPLNQIFSSYNQFPNTTVTASGTSIGLVNMQTRALAAFQFSISGVALASFTIAGSGGMNANDQGQVVLVQTSGNCFGVLNPPIAPDTAPVGVTTIAALGMTSTNQFAYLRTPNVFKTVTATAAGNTAVWTPPAGKSFRVMGVCVEVTSNATLGAAGVETIDFQDNVTSINLAHSVFIPNAALNGVELYSQCMNNMGNGIRSSGSATPLNVNLSTALTAGVVRVRVWGIEE